MSSDILSNVPSTALEKITLPTLKQLMSQSWWAATLSTAAAEALAFITLLHPGFQVPGWVQGAVPAVAQIVAGGVWLWAVAAHKAVATALLQARIHLAELGLLDTAS